MKYSARSAMAAGVSMLAVSAAVIAPLQPTPVPAPAPTVRLAAAVQPVEPGKEPPHIPALLRSSGLVVETSAVQAAQPGVPNVFAIPIAPNLADGIDNLYLAVEPWVQYGFEVATAAIAWIPYVGFLSGLIMDAYFFGESLVASAVFNFTDFLRGDGGIIENLVDFGVDVGLAFVWLGLDALSTFVPLPPCNCYPPRPPVQGPFLALDALTSLMKPEQNAKTMDSTYFDELSTQDESGLAETDSEQLETLGEELNKEQGAPGEELVGELGSEDTGELTDGANGEEELIEQVTTTPEEVVTLEETDPEDSPAAPITTSLNAQNTNGSPEGELDQEPTERQPALSSPAPSTNDDDAQKKTADPDDDPGNATTEK